MKERGDMIKFGATEDESSSMVLNFLEFFNEVQGDWNAKIGEDAYEN